MFAVKFDKTIHIGTIPVRDHITGRRPTRNRTYRLGSSSTVFNSSPDPISTNINYNFVRRMRYFSTV